MTDKRMVYKMMEEDIKKKAHVKAVAALVDQMEGNPLGLQVSFRRYENTQYLDYLDDYGNRFMTVELVAYSGIVKVSVRNAGKAKIYRVICEQPKPTDLPHEGMAPLAAYEVKDLMAKAIKAAATTMAEVMPI